MKATEIVEKLKNILLTSDAEEVEVNDPVELNEEEEVESAPEEEKEELKYATKEEVEMAIAEVKAMYNELMEKMGSEEEKDVPEELSKQEAVEEVDLSAQEPAVEPMQHSPEEVVEREQIRFGQQRAHTTMDTVLSRINK